MTSPNANLPVVYIVGGPSVDNRSNLRYSLRSLANTPVSNVSIVGDNPPWARNVNHIATPQRPNRWADVAAKVRAACDVHKRWILMHDDMFVMRELNKWPIVTRGHCQEFTEDSPYGQRIRETGQWLTAHGHTDWQYDALHSPQVVHSQAMIEALRICELTGLRMFQTIAGNLARHAGSIAANAKSDDGWRERTFVSTSDRRWLATDGVGPWVREQLPTASPWEA